MNEEIKKTVDETVDESKLPVDTQIENLLLKVGVAPRCIGFLFMRDGVKIYMENPTVKVTYGIYPELAKRYGTSAAAVERGIRHAIERCYERDVDCVKDTIGLSPWYGRGKTTNGEFLATIALKIKQRMRVTAGETK